MTINNFDTRTGRNEKRRKNKQKFVILIAFIIVIIIIFFSMIIFGKKSPDNESTQTPITEENQNNASDESPEKPNSENNNPDIPLEEETDEEDNIPELDRVKPNDSELDEEEPPGEDSRESETDVTINRSSSADSNVIETVTGNWPALGTNQTSPHVTVYTDGSDDRVEIKRVVSSVVGIAEDDMIEWWIGNNGDHQTAKATVSNRDQTETYIVYLAWFDDLGWHVTQYDKIRDREQVNQEETE